MSPTLSVDTVLLQHLLNFWDDRGIDLAPVWRELGISAGAPLPPRIASSRLSRLLDELSAVNQQPDLAVSSGRFLATQHLPLTRMLSCACSLQSALPVALDLLTRQAGGVQLPLQVNAAQVVLQALPVHPADSALALLLLAWVVDALCGAGIPAEQLTVQSLHPEQWTAVTHEADRALQIAIPLLFWETRLPNGDVQAFAQVRRELERNQKKFEEVAGLYLELQQIVQQALERRVITQESVADQVGLSVRNLQRRLKTLGTTYQNLLDESRQALAMRLVESSDMPLYEIAFMVGYAEPSAFYKAFRRWTGSTPGDYRQALTETADE